MQYEAGFEAHFIPRALRFAAGLAMHNFGRVAEITPGVQSMSIREPVGVAGLIVPWNSPAYLSVRALAPALAAGCTAAIKMPHVGGRVQFWSFGSCTRSNSAVLFVTSVPPS